MGGVLLCCSIHPKNKLAALPQLVVGCWFWVSCVRTPPLGGVRTYYLGRLRTNTRGVCFADKLKKGRLKKRPSKNLSDGLGNLQLDENLCAVNRVFRTQGSGGFGRACQCGFVCRVFQHVGHEVGQRAGIGFIKAAGGHGGGADADT